MTPDDQNKVRTKNYRHSRLFVISTLLRFLWCSNEIFETDKIFQVHWDFNDLVKE